MIVPFGAKFPSPLRQLKEAVSGQVKLPLTNARKLKSAGKFGGQRKISALKRKEVKGVSSIAVFDALNRFAPKNAVMCVDVGNNAYSFGRYYESKQHNSFLMSGYLGSIGFAFPAAMGAWAAVGRYPT